MKIIIKAVDEKGTTQVYIRMSKIDLATTVFDCISLDPDPIYLGLTWTLIVDGTVTDTRKGPTA